MDLALTDQRAPGAVPRFSVVLASCRSRSLVESAVRSLRGQCDRLGAELIVARAWNSHAEGLEDLLAGCRVVRCPAGASIPELRGAGLAAATGDWAALTEDNCVADPAWLEAMVRAADGGEVMGGAMDNVRRKRALDWGAFFAEYGFFGRSRAAPVPSRGTPPLVTGANVAYARSVLNDVAVWARGGAWEDVIHARLAARGVRFCLVPAAVVGQQLSYRLGPFCRDRFVHGRDYAFVRGEQLSGGARLALAVAVPILPILLSWRIWKSAGRASPGAFLRALPTTLTFLGAWAAGEAVGYLKRRSK